MKAKYMNKFNKYLNNLFSIHLTEAAPFFCLRSPSRRSLFCVGVLLGVLLCVTIPHACLCFATAHR